MIRSKRNFNVPDPRPSAPRGGWRFRSNENGLPYKKWGFYLTVFLIGYGGIKFCDYAIDSLKDADRKQAQNASASSNPFYTKEEADSVINGLRNELSSYTRTDDPRFLELQKLPEYERRIRKLEVGVEELKKQTTNQNPSPEVSGQKEISNSASAQTSPDSAQ